MFNYCTVLRGNTTQVKGQSFSYILKQFNSKNTVETKIQMINVDLFCAFPQF